jgi:ribosomal protein S18 acetylase RimI-like enzyme
VRIRAYVDDDFETVVALWRAVMADTYTFLELHTEAEDRTYFRDAIAVDNELWVAEGVDGIAGYLAIRGDYIDRLYVAVERQGRGVGTALLDHARRLSPEGLRLFTHVRNTGARGFYERRGFVAFRYGVSPPPESEPDVEYRWSP